MTCAEIGWSVLIGLVTGGLSGLISGLAVTKYYRKKDDENAGKMKFHHALSKIYYFVWDIHTRIYMFDGAQLNKRLSDILLRKGEMERYKDELGKHNKLLADKYRDAIIELEVISTQAQIDEKLKDTLIKTVDDLLSEVGEYIKSIDADII